VCVCTLRYPACNARAPYCHVRPVWLYYIFLRYLINATMKKIFLNIKLCFDFHCNFCLKQDGAICGKKSILVIMQSTRFSCQMLMKNFPYRFSKNTQISNLIEIITVGTGLLLADRRIDRHRQTGRHTGG
jgi:hypothetical protein